MYILLQNCCEKSKTIPGICVFITYQHTFFRTTNNMKTPKQFTEARESKGRELQKASPIWKGFADSKYSISRKSPSDSRKKTSNPENKPELISSILLSRTPLLWTRRTECTRVLQEMAAEPNPETRGSLSTHATKS